MSMVDHGSATPDCVCRCSSGFWSASSPAIHILAGEKVCIHAMTPTHAGSELASSICRWIEPASSSTGFHTTLTGRPATSLRRATMACDCEATWSSVSGP